MSRRFWSVALTVALLVTLLPIGPSVAREGEPDPGGVFVFGMLEPGSIDPVNLHESEGIQVGQALFDSLTAWDPVTSEVVPAAAATWEPNVDATVWTFNLVPGATFHNGDPVTAADFKYAWERICDPANESGVSYHLSAVQGYEGMQDGSATKLSGVVALNDTMLQVTLTQPFAEFDAVVAHPTLAPVPQSAVAADGFSEMPVGNGPFMMSEPWVHGEYIKVERFDGYHGAAPNIDGIEFDIFTMR
jgi:oligopeptide transport system substrate-binding protein